MDQGPLVTNQIDAGALLVREFDKFMPLQAAFWLKEGDDGQWFLYLVSDQIDDSNFDLAYGEVFRILKQAPSPWLESLEVKVAGRGNRVVQGILDLQQKYPTRLPRRLRHERLGDSMVEEAYIYALPILVES